MKIIPSSHGITIAPLRSFFPQARYLLLLAVLVLALAPMIRFPLGIAGDYPNHLARVYIEHNLGSSATLQEHFTVEWGIYPDLAMDMFMRPLMAIMDPYTAGAVFNVIAAALLPIGVALLSWVATGRVGLPVVASVLLIYSKPLAWGFINFVFAMGLALCLLALWIKMRPGWPRTALFAALMPILFFSHILGFLLFGYLMLAYEVGRFFAGERGLARGFFGGLFLRDGLIAVIPLALFAASFRERFASLDTDNGTFGGFASRLDALLASLNFDNYLLSTILLTGMCLLLYLAFSRGWLTMSHALRPVLGASIVLVLAVPAVFSGIAYLHIRYGVIPIAILLAGSSLTDAGRARLVPLTAAFISLFALQQSHIYDRMGLLDRAQNDVRAAVASLPQGARLLIGAQTVTPLVNRLNHAPALVIIEADGYVANLFSNTSPVGVSALAMPLHLPQAWPLSSDRLSASANLNPPTKAAESGFTLDYYHGWPQTFEALFWFAESDSPKPEGLHLTPIVENENFILYTVSPNIE
ncbi:hypothetical protein [Yoonia sp. I 8.24]|uniref:hypothetical protein n=1 Tax=Yoonia sp. I 8.24 TaxID=1537229 RepID=UPI001EDD0108|nr:hypothetical protein [Yoonia sp. I 8.24]MCG3268813.1 hypothetical protein [Yoonia sp. I 8.24]